MVWRPGKVHGNRLLALSGAPAVRGRARSKPRPEHPPCSTTTGRVRAGGCGEAHPTPCLARATVGQVSCTTAATVFPTGVSLVTVAKFPVYRRSKRRMRADVRASGSMFVR